MLIEHMGLALVYNRHHLCIIYNLGERIGIEVRYTDGLEQTLLIESFERMPHDGRVSDRPVNQHQIHIVKSQLLHGMAAVRSVSSLV